ncbi:protein serine/threonine phosphatase 2C, partial [Glonium stellatum]
MAFSQWRAAMSRLTRLRSSAFIRNAPPPPMGHIKILQSNIPYRTILIFTSGGATAFALTQAIERTPLEKTVKEASSPPSTVPQVLDVKAATARLQEVERTVPATRVGDVEIPEHHIVRFGSNFPIEDEYVSATAPGPGGKMWHYWGVFDGHAGAATSAHLRSHLIPALTSALSPLPPNPPNTTLTSTVQRAFTALDTALLTTATTVIATTPTITSAALTALAPALSGSCALLSLYNPRTRSLTTACVGDSRAVLGRWNPATNAYAALPLSVDQTGFSALEAERIAAEHPGEDEVVDPKTGRVLGLAVSRAFGDARWKLPRAVVRGWMQRFWGYGERPGYKTPPYLSAEPV